MTSSLAMLLRSDSSQGPTLLAYLYRVLLHVGAVGGVALVAYWSVEQFET